MHRFFLFRKMRLLANFSQAKAYNMKEDTRYAGPWEFGDDTNIANNQGQRQDLIEIHREILDGHTIRQIANDHFGTFCRNHNAIQKFISLTARERDWESQVIVFVGESGVGKSLYCHNKWPALYSVPPRQGKNKWFFGSLPPNTDTVLFDELTGENSELDYMKRVLDRYPLEVEIKGSQVHFSPRTILITTNVHPSDWYNVPWQDSALQRRMTQNNSGIITVQAHGQIENLPDGRVLFHHPMFVIDEGNPPPMVDIYTGDPLDLIVAPDEVENNNNVPVIDLTEEASAHERWEEMEEIYDEMLTDDSATEDL